MPGVGCALATTCALSFGKTSPQDCQIKKGHPLLPEAALPTSRGFDSRTIIVCVVLFAVCMCY